MKILISSVEIKLAFVLLHQNFICQRQFIFSFKFLFELSRFQWHFSFTCPSFLHCAHMTSIFLLLIVRLTFCQVSGSNNFFMANCYFLVFQNNILLHPCGRIERYGNNVIKQNQQPFICLMLKAICHFQNSFVIYFNPFHWLLAWWHTMPCRFIHQIEPFDIFWQKSTSNSSKAQFTWFTSIFFPI